MKCNNWNSLSGHQMPADNFTKYNIKQITKRRILGVLTTKMLLQVDIVVQNVLDLVPCM